MYVDSYNSRLQWYQDICSYITLSLNRRLIYTLTYLGYKVPARVITSTTPYFVNPGTSLVSPRIPHNSPVFSDSLDVLPRIKQENTLSAITHMCENG